MIEIKGKYNEAKIFTDVVDSASIAQVQELCNQEFTAGSRIRLMPDIHAGAGCTIGTTMTITDKVVPNLVGVDIGCGMETTRIREGRLELQKLDKLIYEKIPSGFSIRDKAHRYLDEIDLSELCCAHHVDLLRAEKSIGTLGGGNHFIEVDKDDEGNLYIVVHSGSRHLGVEVASYYQEAGYKVLNRTDDASLQTLVAQMKAEGREKEIQKELKKLKNLKQTSIPKALAYVSGELFEQYIHDMKIVQHFAMLNRQAMMDEIIKGMKLHCSDPRFFPGLLLHQRQCFFFPGGRKAGIWAVLHPLGAGGAHCLTQPGKEPDHGKLLLRRVPVPKSGFADSPGSGAGTKGTGRSGETLE